MWLYLSSIYIQWAIGKERKSIFLETVGRLISTTKMQCVRYAKQSESEFCSNLHQKKSACHAPNLLCILDTLYVYLNCFKSV